MVWFFERSGQFIRCETREDQAGVWELVVAEPEGTERIERFRNGTEARGTHAAIAPAIRGIGLVRPARALHLMRGRTFMRCNSSTKTRPRRERSDCPTLRPEQATWFA